MREVIRWIAAGVIVVSAWFGTWCLGRFLDRLDRDDAQAVDRKEDSE